MAKNTEIAAAQWLAVRGRVIEKLRSTSPRSEETTRTRMAEALILAGYIDVDFIAAEISESERIREEKEAMRRDALAQQDSGDAEEPGE